jgi:peptidoglycan biosynthesis protein MviN/MurJ (putative lipid II flippase)
MAGSIIVAAIGALALLAAALPPLLQSRNEKRTGEAWLPPTALLWYVAFLQGIAAVLAFYASVTANRDHDTPLAFVEFSSVLSMTCAVFAFFAVKRNGAVIGVAANYTGVIIFPMFSLHALLSSWDDYTKAFQFEPKDGFNPLLFVAIAALAISDLVTLSALDKKQVSEPPTATQHSPDIQNTAPEE